MIPGMDGFEALGKTREISQHHILMLTCKGTSSYKVLGLRSGADDYFLNLFNMDK